MSRLFIILSIFESFALFTGAATVEPRPATGIHDQASLLSQAIRDDLASRIRLAREDRELELYIATYDIIRGDTLPERGARLRNAWAESPLAVVLVYDLSVGQMTFVGSRDLETFVSAEQLAGAFQRAAAQAQEYSAAERAAERKPDPGTLIARAARFLLADPILTERMTLREKTRFSGPMMILLAVLVLAALLAATVVWRSEKRLLRSRAGAVRESAFFPTTHRPLRLGAPYSGGQGVTIGEAKSPPPDP